MSSASEPHTRSLKLRPSLQKLRQQKQKAGVSQTTKSASTAINWAPQRGNANLDATNSAFDKHAFQKRACRTAVNAL
jgi:hypothetical protein